MMQLKKTVLDIAAGGNDVLVEAPPQGNPRISEVHVEQLADMCKQI